MNRDDVGGHGDQAHGREVFELPRQFVHQDRVGNVVARIRHQHRVAVFGAACYVGVSQVATATRLVVDHHRLTDQAA